MTPAMPTSIPTVYRPRLRLLRYAVVLGLTLALLGAAALWLRATLAMQAAEGSRSQPSAENRARIRLLPDLTAAGIGFPPRAIALLVFADRGSAELVAKSASDATAPWMPVRRYTLEDKRGLVVGIYRVDALDDAALKERVRLPRLALDEVGTLARAAGEPGLEIVIAPTDHRIGMDLVPDEPMAQALAAYRVSEPPRAVAGRSRAERSVRKVPPTPATPAFVEPRALPVLAAPLDMNESTVRGL
jgi:hypothetical protein